MKTKLISLLICLIASVSFGQKTFVIDDFSKEYYAKIYPDNPEYWDGLGVVKIIHKATERTILTIASNEIMTPPFITYDDYNFDGINDLAIPNNGYNQIYLGVKGGFTFNSAFTQLARDWGGMFSIDPKSKTISVTKTIGCCWNLSETYVVKNGNPYLSESCLNDMYSYYSEIKTTYSSQYPKGRSKVIRFSEDPANSFSKNPDYSELLSVHTSETNGKRIVLREVDGKLNYSVLSKDNIIEFEYDGKFVLENISNNKCLLRFGNKTARYVLYGDYSNQKNSHGIDIYTRGKHYNWKFASGVYLFHWVDDIAFSNVTVK